MYASPGIILSTASLNHIDAFHFILSVIAGVVIALVAVYVYETCCSILHEIQFKRELPQSVADLKTKVIELQTANAIQFPINNASVCKE